MIVLVIVKGDAEIDNFHVNEKSIYRVNTEVGKKNGQKIGYATSPIPLGATIKTENPQVLAVATVRVSEGVQTYINEAQMSLTGAFVNADFFNIFTFPLEEGNSFNIINRPNTAILSKEAAQKLFAHEDAVGKVIKLKGLGNFSIGGVLKKPISKSHLQYDVYLSESSEPILERSSKIDSISNRWDKYTACYTYILTKTGYSQIPFDGYLRSLSARKNIDIRSADGIGYRFSSQPLGLINQESDLILDNSKGMNRKTIIIIISSVSILLCLSCFNYATLTVARGLTRTKEIGIRKVSGASRVHIFAQFIIEAIIIALLSLIFSFILLPLIPLNSSLNNLYSSSSWDMQLLFYILLFGILTGFIAGFLPALLLSKLQTLEVLRNLTNFKILKVKNLSRILITSQFVISFVLVSNVLAIRSQSEYMRSADYGFRRNDLLTIETPDSVDQRLLQKDFSSISGVQSITGLSSDFGSFPQEFDKMTWQKQTSPISVASYYGDENTISAFNLHLIAGQDFWRNSASLQNNRIIINEKAVEVLNLGAPVDAIGKMLKVNDTLSAEVIGVVKNFHFQNFKWAISPMALRYNPSHMDKICLYVYPGMMKKVIDEVKNKWKSLKINQPLEYEDFSKSFEEQQSHSPDVLMLGFLSLIFLAVAGMGLLGMASYSSEIKSREMTIRKILGANPLSIFFRLGKEYCILLVIAFCIGFPTGYYTSNVFLNNFAYRISMGIGISLLVVLIILSFGFLTFSSQIIKLALSSPAKRLSSQ